MELIIGDLLHFLQVTYGADGSFYSVGSYACFWTSTEKDSDNAHRRGIGVGTSLQSEYYYKTSGYSVRLVKDP